MRSSQAPPPGFALRDYARAELDAAIGGLSETGDALHEGVHLARKSVRRTRAALALGDRLLGPGFALVDRELRRFNDGLSSLRDAQALVETLHRLLSGRIAERNRTLLERALEQALAARAQATEQGLCADPGLAQRRALLSVLQAALPALEWQRPTPSSLRMALADSDARIVRARERVASRGQEEDWHRWRRRARRASQQRRALEAAAVPTGDDDTFDKRTAERLGVAQDLSLLLAHCGDNSPFSKQDRAALVHYARPALKRLRKRIAASGLK